MKQVADMAEQLKNFNQGTNLSADFRNGTPTKISKLPVIKSPSEPTIYGPAIKLHSNLKERLSPDVAESEESQEIDVINNYLNNIRLGGTNAVAVPSTSTEGETQETTNRERKGNTTDPQQQRNLERSKADEAILAAERYKATIQQPPEGRNDSLNQNLDSQILNTKLARYFDNDDDEFFHITCHIEPHIRAKIKLGQFVELEKLLQKPEALMYKRQDRYQMTFIDGEQVWTQAIDKSTKIDGIRKWEKAFRVYAAIYCEANPHRSVELLQYIESINDAAKKFSWEKVAHYDFVFRHLQAERPHRNWGKTYMQMYVRLAGDDHYQQQQSRKQVENGGSSQTKATCYRFNKGQHCSYGRECRFEHKCSYCQSSNHCYSACRRKPKKRRSESRQRNRSPDETYRSKEKKRRERSPVEKKE